MRRSCLRSSFSQLLLLGAAAAFSAAVHAQSTMSPEELAVRTAYARLAFATETTTVTNSVYDQGKAANLDADLAASRLRVTLSSFRVGHVSDLDSRTSLGDMADAPLMPLIVRFSDAGWQDEKGRVSQLGATAAWSTEQRQAGAAGLPWPVTGDGITYGDFDPKDFSRYAWYLATFTVGGETRAARATILFNDKGRFAVVDGMVGGPLLRFLTTSVYPHVLMETPARSKPHVAAWLQGHTYAAPGCVADQQHECFDAATGAIQIHPQDMERSLVIPPARKEVPASPPLPADVYVYQPKARIPGVRPEEALSL